MFQATRQRLALWYTAVTAVLLLLFASGFYLYVRSTLVERVDDTLNHVVEVMERSLVMEPQPGEGRVFVATTPAIDPGPALQVNVEASFGNSARAVEDDHIDLEWFSPQGTLQWSTLSEALPLPLHVNPAGETVRAKGDTLLRQVTERVQRQGQVVGYLRVSHPWFEVTKPSRRLMVDLALGTSLMVGAVGAIGWLLSGIAMAPVRDSYQQLKQFTADASHELRNPIAVIQTNAQVALLDPEPEVAVLQQQFQVIERLTRRLGQLVDDLLFLTRQDSGLLALTPHCIDLDPLLSEVMEEQQVLAREGQIRLQVQSPNPRTITPGYSGEWGSPPGLVWGDRDQLTRLFTNLLGNALQYTPAGDQVSLHWQPIRHQGQPWLQVVVQDNGMGIAPEALAHVFDRFYRADPARRRRGDQGSGLGLAIARAIVENHGGTIQVQSQPQRGTTVTVLLPQAEQGEA